MSSEGESGQGQIVRYGPAMRINHWIVAGSFILVALSGLALFHPALFWLTNLFGGGPWARILHPFIGLVMVAAFALIAAKLWRDNIMMRYDWEWLGKIKDVVENREENLPAIGKYNAGQKLLFYTIILCLLGLLASGIVIWRAYFAIYFPIPVIRLAALLHAFCGFVLICSIVVHIYAAIWVKGSVRAMTRGVVSYGWAWKHHRLWFREMTKGRQR
jgi:formate dehydrogenase subunit gamma